MGSNIRKYRFYNRYTLGVYFAPLLAVYFFNHGWGKIIRRVAYRDI